MIIFTKITKKVTKRERVLLSYQQSFTKFIEVTHYSVLLKKRAMDDTKLVIIEEYDSYERAYLIKEMLEENGIKSAFWDANMASVFPSLEGIGMVKLVVNEEDEAKTRKLIAAWEKGKEAPHQ